MNTREQIAADLQLKLSDLLYRYHDGQCPYPDCPNGEAGDQINEVCQLCWAENFIESNPEIAQGLEAVQKAQELKKEEPDAVLAVIEDSCLYECPWDSTDDCSVCRKKQSNVLWQQEK